MNQQYLIELLKNGSRINGRQLNETRKPQVTFGDNGEVEISTGETKVLVKVSSEITKPYEDKGNEGILIINNNIEDLDVLTRIIEKSIRKSASLDLESLCIITGKLCWLIRIDLTILNFDGNLIDICLMGIMINLLNYKLPSYDLNQGQIKLYNLDEKPPLSLSILHIPICFTILFFNPLDKETNLKSDDVVEISIFDADSQEESLRDSYLVVTVNSNKEIIQMSKLGGIPINSIEVINLCQICFDKALEMTQWIKELIISQKELDLNNLQMLTAIGDR